MCASVSTRIKHVRLISRIQMRQVINLCIVGSRGLYRIMCAVNAINAS